MQHPGRQGVGATRAPAERVAEDPAVDPGLIDFVDAAEREGRGLRRLRRRQVDAATEPDHAIERGRLGHSPCLPVRQPRQGGPGTGVLGCPRRARRRAGATRLPTSARRPGWRRLRRGRTGAAAPGRREKPSDNPDGPSHGSIAVPPHDAWIRPTGTFCVAWTSRPMK